MTQRLAALNLERDTFDVARFDHAAGGAALQPAELTNPAVLLAEQIDGLRERWERRIRALAEERPGLTPAERARRLDEIRARRRDLELVEEQRIDEMEASGVEIARRPYASPEVILGKRGAIDREKLDRLRLRKLRLDDIAKGAGERARDATTERVRCARRVHDLESTPIPRSLREPSPETILRRARQELEAARTAEAQRVVEADKAKRAAGDAGRLLARLEEYDGSGRSGPELRERRAS